MKISSKQILITAFLIVLLAMVRALQKMLFYDPFQVYFEGEFTKNPFPHFDTIKLLTSLVFRYGLNSIFSLGIIYTVFKDSAIVKFASSLYGIIFIVLMISFFGILIFLDSDNAFLLFYVRRFLVQPILILLFLPAFYFQKSHQ